MVKVRDNGKNGIRHECQ